MIEITSKDNQQLKNVRRIRDGKDRGRIHIEGVRLFEEALRSNVAIEQIFATGPALNNERISSAIRESGSTAYLVSDPILSTISDTESPQGIVATALKPVHERDEIEERLRSSSDTVPLILLLDRVNNPSNLGAIVRSAEAAGIAGIITSVGSADVFSPKAIRGSMGSCFRFPVWQQARTGEVFAWANELDLLLIGLTGSGESSIYEFDWSVPRLLVAGSEAHGISQELLSILSGTVSIPIAETVESLNLNVAASVTLFEARRGSIGSNLPAKN